MRALFLVFTIQLIFIAGNAFGQLNASFTSPDVDQCQNSLFTLSASNTSYSTYNWLITGPSGYNFNSSNNPTSLNQFLILDL